MYPLHTILGSYYKLNKYFVNELIYVKPVFKSPDIKRKLSKSLTVNSWIFGPMSLLLKDLRMF